MPMRRTPMVAVPAPAPREPWRAVRRRVRYGPRVAPTGRSGAARAGAGAVPDEGWVPTDAGETRDVARWRGSR